jgi:hypothetical protein
MILPPRPIVEPEIADLSALREGRSDRFSYKNLCGTMTTMNPPTFSTRNQSRMTFAWMA